MGNTNAASGHHGRGMHGLLGDLQSMRPDTWPLQFHGVHGINIEISPNKIRAKRYDSFCKGICFSNRPVGVNEKVYVRFVETSTSWSGVLRFGFTSNDPATLQGSELPRYACPDLTNKPGFWAKALGERYANTSCLLCFWVTRVGDVHYSMDGEEKGVFFSNVITTGPLWALLDIYGNTCAVEFTQEVPDHSIHLNNRLSMPTSPTNSLLEQELFSFSAFSVNESSQLPAVRYHTNVDFQRMLFHETHGRNIRLTSEMTVACRHREEYCNSYVFTSSPLKCGEKVVIQILGIDRSYVGGLAFGLTSCDPRRISPDELPDDSDLLLDRPEYWVVNKDVCRTPDIGDELSFFLTQEGEVRYSRNNHKIATLMHVDRTLPLWAFFDVYGNVQKIKLLGATNLTGSAGRLPRSRSASSYTGTLPQSDLDGSPLPQPPPRPPPPVMAAPLLRSYSMPTQPTPMSPTTCGALPPMSPVLPTSMPVSPTSGSSEPPDLEESNECAVCCEQPVNCVLYTCGHMCMCYDCAVAVRKDKGGLCPICRQHIKDIIRTYRS